MAVVLKKLTLRINTSAIASGIITKDTSPTVALYQISRYWRELFERSTRHKSEEFPNWSEKEVSAGKIILSTLLYLSMQRCNNVEKLLNDLLENPPYWPPKVQAQGTEAKGQNLTKAKGTTNSAQE